MRATDSHWQADPDPHERQFDVIRSVIEHHAHGRRILDVGCFNGALLSYLGEPWQRHGVEPSQSAAIRAAERGVQILGSTLDEVPVSTAAFDVILLIDVVEHLVEPMPALCRATALLRENGILVILTGNTQCWPWRLQGSRYWYCSLPEHVSFFCQRTFDAIGEQLHLQPLECRTMSHIRSDLVRRTRKTLKGLTFAMLQSILPNRSAPGWLTASDHVFQVMRRSG